MAAYRDAKNVSRRAESDAGFLLAMSRSNFNPAKQGTEKALHVKRFRHGNGCNVNGMQPLPTTQLCGKGFRDLQKALFLAFFR